MPVGKERWLRVCTPHFPGSSWCQEWGGRSYKTWKGSAKPSLLQVLGDVYEEEYCVFGSTQNSPKSFIPEKCFMLKILCRWQNQPDKGQFCFPSPLHDRVNPIQDYWSPKLVQKGGGGHCWPAAQFFCFLFKVVQMRNVFTHKTIMFALLHLFYFFTGSSRNE